jgi:hypothetical protein
LWGRILAQQDGRRAGAKLACNRHAHSYRHGLWPLCGEFRGDKKKRRDDYCYSIEGSGFPALNLPVGKHPLPGTISQFVTRLSLFLLSSALFLLFIVIVLLVLVTVCFYCRPPHYFYSSLPNYY